MNPRAADAAHRPSLSVEEVRLIADLRFMHAEVDGLYHFVDSLKRRHSEADVHKYSDARALAEDIRKVDELYLWFIKLKEHHDRHLPSAD